MNQKGWGMANYLFYMAFFLLMLLFVSWTASRLWGDIKENIDNNDKPLTEEKEVKKTYTSLEQEVIEATKSYANKYYQTISEGDYVFVSIKKLKEESFIDKVIDVKDSKIECSGYGSFIKQSDQITYEAKIKCGKNYTSANYQERLDIK